MAKKPRLYQRLTRPVAGLASYTSLWMGPDHLMIAQSSGYTEQYQRFQYSDIQAILARDSDRRMIWNVVWVVGSVISVIPLISALLTHQTPIISSVFTGLFAVAITINLLMGPSCRVYLVTRVQTAALPIVRRKKAERLFARVQPLIQAAQADLLTAPDVVPVSPPHIP